ncbi:MAG: transposase [Leptospirillum sp.]
MYPTKILCGCPEYSTESPAYDHPRNGSGASGQKPALDLPPLLGFTHLLFDSRSPTGVAALSRSGLKSMKEVAHLIKRHMANLLTHITHPITNGISEG